MPLPLGTPSDRSICPIAPGATRKSVLVLDELVAVLAKGAAGGPTRPPVHLVHHRARIPEAQTEASLPKVLCRPRRCVAPRCAGTVARMLEPFFRQDADGGFVASESTRGPWSRDYQHGGAPAALTVRAMERIAAQTGTPALMRATFDLIRPVPITRLVVEAEALPGGRGVRRIQARVLADGVEVLRAAGLFGASRPTELVAAPPPVGPPPLDLAKPTIFPFFRWPVGYHTAMQLVYARGKLGDASVFAWLRTRVPIVEGEAPSPAQRVLVAADSGNGVTAALDWNVASFVNPDLTVALGRLPEGEWVGLEVEMRTERSGLGLASTRLWDERGPIGHGLQTLVVREVGAERAHPERR